MQGPVENKIAGHVPLKTPQRGTCAEKLVRGERVIAHLIKKHVPVTRRRFGIRTIGPKFSKDASLVSPEHAVGSVRFAGDRISGTT